LELAEITSESVRNKQLLSLLCEIDCHVSVLASYMRSSHARQQAIAAALAPTIMAPKELRRTKLQCFAGLGACVNDADLLAAAGEPLLRESARSLLARAFGVCPNGLRGALARSNASPPRFYIDLFLTFALPDRRAMAKALLHEPVIDYQMLRAIQKIPSWMLLPGIASKLAQTDVDELLSAVQLLQECTDATPLDFARSLPLKSTAPRPFDHWISKWLRKANLPAGPLGPDQFLQQIQTVRELHVVGKRMRNCLASKTLSALSGETCYYRWTADRQEHVIELMMTGQWVLGDVYATRNACVDPQVRLEVSGRLASLGISSRGGPPADKWAALRRAVNRSTVFADFFE
jgi:hypothetical protein